MDPAKVNSNSSTEPMNETSAMDIDGSSELRDCSSESKDKYNIHSVESGTPSQSNSKSETEAGDRGDSRQSSSNSVAAVNDVYSADDNVTDITDSSSSIGDNGTAVIGNSNCVNDDASPVCEGAAAVIKAGSDSGNATSTHTDNAASSHTASASAGDTSVAETTHAIKNHGANPVFLSQLLEMGVPANLAIRALLFSGNSSVEAAFTWLAELSAEEADALSCRPVEDDAHDWEDVDEEDEKDTFSHKMALVVDASLRMKPGKTAAQVGHAVLGLYRVLQRTPARQRASALTKWENTGEKMVVLRASDGNQLRLLKRKADAVRLPAYLVTDAGLTQIAQGSVTVLAIFGTNTEVDLVTGDLKLL